MAAIAVIGISLTGVSSGMALAGERSEIEAGVRARTAIDGDRDHKVVAVEPKKVVVARVVASKPAAPKVDIAKVAAPKDIVEPKVVVAPKIVVAPKVVVAPKAVVEPKVVAAPKVVVEPKVIEAPKVVTEPKVVESPKVVAPKVVVASLPKEAAPAFVTPAKVVMAPEIDPASAASGLTLLLGSVLVALGRRRQTETLG
jgi:hypothetical protein